MGELESDGAMALSMQNFLGEKGSLNALRLEVEDQLLQVEQLLRGKHYDYFQKKYIEHGPQLMNEQGIREVMLLMRLHANKMFLLSNFDERKIGIMLHNYSCALLEITATKCDYYDLDRNIRGTLTRSLENFGWSIMLRALDDGERTHMDTINKVVEQVVQREVQQKAAGIGMLRFGQKQQDGGY